MRRHRTEGYGLDFGNLPPSKPAAEASGATYFFTGKPCKYGHLAPRYTKGGSCSWCTRTANARKVGKTFNGEMPKALANAARAEAHDAGAKTYIPPHPCPRGHRLRWVASTNCVECDREKRASYAEARKSARIKKLYGLSAQAHMQLFLSQGRSCAVCLEKFASHRAMHVDHCHKSKKVRGLLCSRCNQALGLFRDDPVSMMRAAEYVNDDAPALSNSGA